MTPSDEVSIEGLVEAKQVSQELLVVWYLHTYILYWLVPTGLFRVNLRKIRDYP